MLKFLVISLGFSTADVCLKTQLFALTMQSFSPLQNSLQFNIKTLQDLKLK